jgi:hypothetical protein
MQFLLLFLYLSSFSICKLIIFNLLFFHLYILFVDNVSILPESPRWLISEQRYDDAELLLHHIAEKNKTHFDLATYQRFVKDDKKVNTKYLCLRCTLYFFILQRMASSENQDTGFRAVFRSKVMCIVALNMSYQW